ncbi:MAG: family 65 glycosyl hydrolase [Treponema sp.]|nr:family 65 glycosyl hydrolase [Treponema sp.]
MSKYADRFFKVDPWKIIETEFDMEHRLVSESVFSLANEYMGIRGYFEEGSDLPSLRGAYFNGVYEIEESANPSAYKGIVNSTHFMVNAPDWLYTSVFYEDEQLVMGRSNISEYSRVLDLKNGILKRSFIWHLQQGRQIKMVFERFLDMNHVVRAYQRISCIPINFSGEIRIQLGINSNVIHESRREKYWKTERYQFIPDGAILLSSTVHTKQFLCSGFLWWSNQNARSKPLYEEGLAVQEIFLPLVQGEISCLDKHIINLVEKDNSAEIESLWEAALVQLSSIKKEQDYMRAKEDQTTYWASLWDRMDIEIKGDDLNQQGIRFCIFQMQQTYHGYDANNNIGAKGLTGEAYNGHAFWDTETYCLPFYLFNNIQAAKNLLLFRYKTLPQAKERAKMLDGKGACFPIATLNGEEACDLWQHASLQFQPSTGVAYGIYHYHLLSNDDEFLFNYGAELLVEISRFLLSRGAWNADRSGFGFYAVMGPDEFHMMVNHNTYTNYMAKKTFEYTCSTLERMQKMVPEAYSRLVIKLGITDNELNVMKECAEKMILLYDNKTKLFEQHEGYFNLPHINIDDIPVTDFPLYHHWSYDRIYRTDMIKQPDVLMFIFLYNNEFSLDIKKVNYEFYEPRTIHESSLSPSVHSILAAEIGKYEEAYSFFNFATRMDLDNYNRNSGEGLHTTSIAAAWMNIVYGFGGLRSDGPILKLSPSIPRYWHSYSFNITYRKYLIRIHVDTSMVHIVKLEGPKEPLLFELYGNRVALDSSGLHVKLPEMIRS